MREEVGELVAHVTVACFRTQDLHIGRKLRQKLPARTARRAPVLAVGIDRDPAKSALAFADRLAAGSPLRADRASQCRILHVAARIHTAVVTLDRRADRKTGIRYISVH